MVSITGGASLWYRPSDKNMLNFDNDNKCWKQQCKSRFSLIAEQILASASSTNLIRKVKNLSLIFKQIA